MTLAVTAALQERLAAPERTSAGFTYSIVRAGPGLVRVQWAGGTRNGVAVPDGDVTTALDRTYDRLLAALKGGGFLLGTGGNA